MLQEKNRNVIQRANEREVVAARDRGVVAARRYVSDEGQITLQRIADALHPALLNKAHLKSVRRIGVTVIGFSRFDQLHQDLGPPTDEVTECVETSYTPLKVELGRIGVYGTEPNGKLGISLISADLRSEEEAIEAVFGQRGYPLPPDPYRQSGFDPHVTIAQIHSKELPFFQDSHTLNRLEILAGLGPTGSLSIMLDPIKAGRLISY